MRRLIGSFLPLLVCAALLLSPAAAVEPQQLEQAIENTAAYLLESVKTPQVGSIGGEWAVLALARSEYPASQQFYQSYYRALEDYVRQCDGVLHEKKYTEYSRVVLALTAIGKDPQNVAGYDLLTPLGDYNRVILQGINGPIFALLALDSGGYDMPQNEQAQVQAQRQMYVEKILEAQLPGGGFSLSGKEPAEPDLTGMALQALAKYQQQEKVKEAVEKGLNVLSAMQEEDGGYSSFESSNSESVVQVIVALCELGIPFDDSRFVKAGNTLLDNLMSYYTPGAGFSHTSSGDGSNQMATEQGLYGMVAADRAAKGKSSLYSMEDPLQMDSDTVIAVGLPNKNEAVTKRPVCAEGKTFDDMKDHPARIQVEKLAQRGIVSGISETEFGPERPITRAEFAAIMVKGLGLALTEQKTFQDVEEEAWYFPYISTAYKFGIVSGTSPETFQPEGLITREEAAVMVARGAELCGLNMEMDEDTVRNFLAGFTDYTTSSDWAMEALAFCCAQGILPSDALEIRPQDPATRAQVAQMLYNCLAAAQLL